jgi:hypothetical protein
LFCRDLSNLHCRLSFLRNLQFIHLLKQVCSHGYSLPRGGQAVA